MNAAIKVIDDVIFHLKLERFEGEKPLKMGAEKLQTHPKNVLRGAVAGVGLILALTLLFFAQCLLYVGLSVAYPAFATARTVSQDHLFMRDGKHWLAYWTCFGLLTIAEELLGFILDIIPLFGLVKCVLVVWLFNHKTKGAEVVFHSLIEPQLKKYGGSIESKIEQVQETVERVTKTD